MVLPSQETAMYKNPYSSEETYNLDETAHILGKTRMDVEGLMRQKSLGFEICDYGPVVTSRHIASYQLGEKPRTIKEYQSVGPKRKLRKLHVKARTRRQRFSCSYSAVRRTLHDLENPKLCAENPCQIISSSRIY